MPRYVAFLRAINVGGHIVAMEKLRDLFTKLGFEDVETFIASGNVIFTTPSKNTRALQRKIEGHLQKSLGYEVRTFIRSDAEVATIARYKPFKGVTASSATPLNVAFVDVPPEANATRSLMALRNEIDDFHVSGREVYWLRKKNPGDSRFSYAAFEKIIKGKATFRNVNTVARLAAKYPQAKITG